MAITQTQITAIATRLAVDLSVVSNDRLIELCLLHRAAPDALPSFLVGLETELVRRFTAQYIAANDVIFAVLQNFANNFASPVPYFQMQMIQMAATVNRDIWFQNNTALFTASIDDIDVMTWLVTQPDILQKCLNNSFGLTMIAQSTTASTVILTNDPAVTLWKQATGLWIIWPSHSAGMNVLALSSELMSYIAASSTAMTAVAASSTAMTAVIASSTAMTAVAASSTAMTAVAASSTAMTAVAASSTAMTAVAASSTALSKIVVSTLARNALMANNTVFQSVRQQMFSTVRANWTKRAALNQESPVNSLMTTINSAIASPLGFVFGSLGNPGAGYTTGLTEAKHPNNTIANTAGTSASPSTLTNLDVVTFNGAVFTSRNNYGHAHAELWIPPAA